MFFLLFGTAALAGERPPEVGFTVEPVVAVDIQNVNENADDVEAWTWIRAQAEQQTETGRWFLAVDGEHQIRHGLDTEAIWNMYVGESGWAGKWGSTHVRAGALIERWGKLDLVPVIDVLNPSDLRAGPLATIEALRIPVPMATIQTGGERFRAEATWAPFASSDRVTVEGSDWSLIKPGMLQQYADEMASWDGSSAIVLSEPLEQLADSLNRASPSTIRSLTGTASGIDRPEDNGLYGNFGLRLAVEAPGVDAALVGANLQSPIPSTQVSPDIRRILTQEALPEITEIGALLENPPIETRWPRSWMAGGELSTVIGPIGLRSEVGWWSNKVVQMPWFTSSESPALAAAGGLDWAHGSTLMLSAEGRWHRWLQPPRQMFLTKADTIEVGGTARLSIANEKVQILSAALVDLSYGEWMTRPEVRWRISDPLELGLGAILIGGVEQGPQTLQESLTWKNGPLGLMADNDAVFFSFRWMQ